jgi:membrane-bound lytic murein transglycosylase B
VRTRAASALLVTLLAGAPALARAQSSDESFAAFLEAARVSAVLTAAAAKPSYPDVATPAQARALIKGALAGSGVPDSFLDAALADPRARVIDAVADRFLNPAGPSAPIPYDQYKRWFLTEKRISQGAAFLKDHGAVLAQARARDGVDPGLLTALVGVETFYGANTGTFPVFDALYTVVRKVRRRQTWGAKEAAAFLAMAYRQGLDAHGVRGSYAGAFGYVQFEPSSYARFAVDFDGDGRTRIDEWPDALGSAAHYLVLAGYDPKAAFDPSSAIGRSLYAYNHSDNYVRVILDLRAAILARAAAPAAVSARSAGAVP